MTLRYVYTDTTFSIVTDVTFRAKLNSFVARLGINNITGCTPTRIRTGSTAKSSIIIQHKSQSQQQNSARVSHDSSLTVRSDTSLLSPEESCMLASCSKRWQKKHITHSTSPISKYFDGRNQPSTSMTPEIANYPLSVHLPDGEGIIPKVPIFCIRKTIQ